jgi:hypothetical protein
MAVVYTPVTWWSGYTTDATNLQVTWDSLADVEDTTTDIREIVLALLNETKDHQDTLTGDAIPTKFEIESNKRYDESGDEIEQTFTVRFDLTPTTTLASE